MQADGCKRRAIRITIAGTECPTATRPVIGPANVRLAMHSVSTAPPLVATAAFKTVPLCLVLNAADRFTLGIMVRGGMKSDAGSLALFNDFGSLHKPYLLFVEGNAYLCALWE